MYIYLSIYDIGKDLPTISSDGTGCFVTTTQIDIHKKFGGVVPEVASRKHIENIDPVVQEALDTAGMTFYVYLSE